MPDSECGGRHFSNDRGSHPFDLQCNSSTDISTRIACSLLKVCHFYSFPRIPHVCRVWRSPFEASRRVRPRRVRGMNRAALTFLVCAHVSTGRPAVTDHHIFPTAAMPLSRSILLWHVTNASFSALRAVFLVMSCLWTAVSSFLLFPRRKWRFEGVRALGISGWAVVVGGSLPRGRFSSRPSRLGSRTAVGSVSERKVLAECRSLPMRTFFSRLAIVSTGAGADGTWRVEWRPSVRNVDALSPVSA